MVSWPVLRSPLFNRSFLARSGDGVTGGKAGKGRGWSRKAIREAYPSGNMGHMGAPAARRQKVYITRGIIRKAGINNRQSSDLPFNRSWSRSLWASVVSSLADLFMGARGNSVNGYPIWVVVVRCKSHNTFLDRVDQPRADRQETGRRSVAWARSVNYPL